MSSADENDINFQTQDNLKETKRSTINDNKKDGKFFIVSLLGHNFCKIKVLVKLSYSSSINFRNKKACFS